ncbi:MAG: ThuA domain-containing protein [Oscillospiraceae bacterium]|nr:ThuA domain-containing protein [Oscillospiraceae bacterium]MDD3832787.1 ThuA domain-containing protein [Oscillospiraceae bacterium]MDD4545966.1 ThuA domain-containing protein [Oscillospiraceae bacterium]
MIKVTVWNENIHDKNDQKVKDIYPEGIHGAIEQALNKMEGIEAHTATLDQPECGLSDEVLDNTDVLIWWGHVGHHLVPDELVGKVTERILKGMGFIALHSAHYAKPFTRLMGTSCSLRWREGEFERVWCVNPGHPIAEGIPPCFELELEEMYGEYFDIPQPESLVFNGWFRSGEVFRSGCCWTRGLGHVFYFQPGHETFPTYNNPIVQRILGNAVRWAAPRNTRPGLDCYNHIAIEDMYKKGQGIGWY